MKKAASTEYAVLGALMSGPRHGYEILRHLDKAFGSIWQLSASQLYLLLKRLEKEGFLRSNIKAQKARPSKRVFSLTPSGRRIFLDWVHSPTEHVRDLRIEFLAKLFFSRSLSLKGGNNLLENQFLILEKVREGMQRSKDNEKEPFMKLVWGAKIATLEAWVQWLGKEATPFIKEKK